MASGAATRPETGGLGDRRVWPRRSPRPGATRSRPASPSRTGWARCRAPPAARRAGAGPGPPASDAAGRLLHTTLGQRRHRGGAPGVEVRQRRGRARPGASERPQCHGDAEEPDEHREPEDVAAPWPPGSRPGRAVAATATTPTAARAAPAPAAPARHTVTATTATTADGKADGVSRRGRRRRARRGRRATGRRDGARAVGADARPPRRR